MDSSDADFVDDKAKSAEQQAGDEVDGALKDDAIQKLDVAIEALSAAQKQKELSTEESKHVSELKIVAESLKTLHMDTADQIKRSINDLTNHASTLKLSVAESAEHAGAKETAKINSASDAGLKALEAKLDTCKEKLTSTHESLMNVYKTQHERLMAEMNQKHIDYSEQQEEKFRKDMEEMDLKHQQWLERETKQNQLLTDKAAQKIGHQRQLAERQGDHLLKKIEVKQDHFIANSQAKFDDNKKLADEVRNELTSCINQVYVMTVELAKTKKQLAAMQQTNYSTWEGMLVNLEAAGTQNGRESTVLSDSNLFEIARNTSPYQTLQLGLQLGLSSIEIEHMENSPTSQRTAANQIFNVLRTACEKMLREGKNIEEVTESLSGALQKSHSAQALSILNKLIDQQAASTLAPARNDARAGGTPTQPTSAAAARTHAQTQPTRLAAVPVRAPDEPEEFEDGLL